MPLLAFLPPVGESSVLRKEISLNTSTEFVSTPCRGIIRAEGNKFDEAMYQYVSTPCRGIIRAEVFLGRLK